MLYANQYLFGMVKALQTLILILSLPLALSAQTLALEDFPSDNHFYPQDRVTNTADVPISGTINSPGYLNAVVEIDRMGTPHSSYTFPVTYSGSIGNFAGTIPLVAERANYTFKLFLEDGTGSTLFRSSENVVAGDAYLVHGQSNAFAFAYTSGSDVYMDSFIRTFGRQGGVFNSNDSIWNFAKGDGGFGNPRNVVGQWGLVMANRLTQRQQIPIAVINHAVGGRQIDFFLKGDTTNTTLNYSTLLERLKVAGIRNELTGIIWYQGESDAYSPANAFAYQERFETLYNSFRDDFGAGLRRIFVCQTRPGCGGAASQHNIISEFLRRAADSLQGVTVISTNGLDAHDGCHYQFEGGYRELGFRVAANINRYIYGAPAIQGIDAPNVLNAYYANPANSFVAINLRDAAEILDIEPGVENDFVIKGGPNVIGVSQSGGALLLQLAGPSTGTEVRYLNHLGSGPDLLGRFGQGLLSFTLDIAPYSPRLEGAEVQQQVSVFPNPAGDQFYLNLNDVESEVIISDLRGSVIYQTSASETQNISTTNWPAGMYIINVSTSTGQQRMTLMVD